MQERFLPIYTAQLEGLNTDLKHLVIASDLQGIVGEGEDAHQLSIALLDKLLELNEQEALFDVSQTAVILCGDLYAEAHKRKGVYGDVRYIWQAYNAVFKSVVGVAGNHDAFGSKDDFDAFIKEEGIYFLDNDIINLDGIKVGGLSGMIGKTTKNQRKDKDRFLAQLKALLQSQCDFILLHEGPAFKAYRKRGNSLITEVIMDSKLNNRVFFGHRNWGELISTSMGNTSLLNTDAKCLIVRL